MLSLPLEPTDDLASPAFRDAASCAKWLGQLQLTNLHQVHGVVRTQLNEFNRYPMRGLERLRTLELLGETVSHLQTDYAKKLAARKLPLSEDELTIFVSILDLWQQMVHGYQRCLQALLAGDKSLAAYAPLLCQRCLMYTGLQIFEHLRTGYEFEGKLWQQLHALYAFSADKCLHLEKISVLLQLHALYDINKDHAAQLEKMADELDRNATSCHTIYVKTLLTCYARPAELPRGQALLLDRWLTQWSLIIPVEHHYATSKGDAPPLAVDLASLQGLQALSLIKPSPQPTGSENSSLRYLPMAPLSKLLRVKTILLQQGQLPQHLDLGESGSSVDCAAFLGFLHQCWCEDQGERRAAERRRVALAAHLCYGLEDIFAHIAQRPFQSVSKNVGADSLGHKQIATFGRVLAEDQHRQPTGFCPSLEAWQIEDESLLGARLLRAGITGDRLGLNQLVAVRPTDAKAFILGTLSWAHVTLAGRLSAGVRYLPGVAQAVIIESVGVNLTAMEKSAAALLLPAVAALKTPSSLLVPRNWFQAGRVIEISRLDNQKQKVKLEFSVECGVDYERVSFAPA